MRQKRKPDVVKLHRLEVYQMKVYTDNQVNVATDRLRLSNYETRKSMGLPHKSHVKEYV